MYRCKQWVLRTCNRIVWLTLLSRLAEYLQEIHLAHSVLTSEVHLALQDMAWVLVSKSAILLLLEVGMSDRSLDPEVGIHEAVFMLSNNRSVAQRPSGDRTSGFDPSQSTNMFANPDSRFWYFRSRLILLHTFGSTYTNHGWLIWGVLGE